MEKTEEKDSTLSAGTKNGEAKPRVQSALRTVSILLAIAQSSNGLKIKEIMEHLNLSRQVTYHLIHTLHATGIIRKNVNGRYVLGLAAGSIADGFHRQLAPPEHLAPKVRAVASATGETSYAVGWLNGEIVVLATARGNSPVGAAEIPQGFSGHAHARASGKLLLALAEPATCEAYLAEHPLVQKTPNTITDRGQLIQEFQTIRERGYSVDHEEFHEGLRCLAVPVSGLGARFALGISVPSERFQANFERYLSQISSIARVDEVSA
jgi:IclR family acetate operon transcriptional repressor